MRSRHLGFSSTPLQVSRAARGVHAAALFLAGTSALGALGGTVLTLPASDPLVSLLPIVAVLLGFLFIGSIALSESYGHFYAFFLSGLLLFGPVTAFVLVSDPNLYLLHIAVSSVCLSIFAAAYRRTDSSRLAIAADFLVSLSVSIIFWLSLGRLPANPWGALIVQADEEAVSLSTPLLGGAHVPAAFKTLLELRLASATISLVLFAIFAMARTIHAEIPSVPPLSQLPRINSARPMILTPLIVLFNAITIALTRLASITWFVCAIAAIYLYEFCVRFLVLLRDRFISSGILFGFLRAVACYALWGSLMLIARWLPWQVLHYIGSDSGYSHEAFGHFGFSILLSAAGLVLLYFLVELEIGSHPSLAINMSHGVTIVILSVVFASLALYSLASFGFITYSGVCQLGPFLVLCSSLVGVTVAGMLVAKIVFGSTGDGE